MIVSWNWLTDYVAMPVPPEELEERLTQAGLKHEGTVVRGTDRAMDLEVTSNRPDCLGHLGVAREVAAVLGTELTLPPTDFAESDTPTSELTSVTLEPGAEAWCPQYRARLIENVQIGPSPDWLRARLEAVGLASINNVVDITNFVMLECGQPLHAFDYEQLRGRRIVVRSGRSQEPFRAINNRDYVLDEKMGVIADAERAVALAGIMGGAWSEVTGQTRTILLESAQFLPLPIRRTSRALELSSESSHRFERAIDPAGVVWASDRACHLLARYAGGQAAKGAIHVGGGDDSRAPISLRWDRIGRILSLEIPERLATEYLARLGIRLFSRDESAGRFVPPSFRRDLTREIDLIEEIGRLHGYEGVAADKPIPLTLAAQRPRDRVLERARRALSATGFDEAITFSFSDMASVRAVRPWTMEEPLTVRHSSRRQENCLRQSLLPSLLSALAFNLHRDNDDARLYELAHIYIPKPGEFLPSEPEVLGLVGAMDLRQMRGAVESIFAQLGMAAELVPAAVVGFTDGRSAQWKAGGAVIGVLGEISASTRAQWDLKRPVVAAEILVAPLVAGAQLIPRCAPVPDQPASVRDFAFVLDERTRWVDLEQVCRKAAGPSLERFEFVDLYRGPQVPAGKKSIAVRFTYRDPERTLTHAEVDAFQESIRQSVAEQLGGTLRA